MGEVFERHVRIDEAVDGEISGVLATNGEASDGHIIDLRGMTVTAGAPLLFGHDDWTGRGNLGSWTSFDVDAKTDKLGSQTLRGTARIETEGVGAQAEFRADMAQMIERGHIGQFSVRWDALEPPVRRTNLSKDHPAFIDAGKAADDPRRWGLFFGKSRLMEGSVVTLGADPKAIIGRMQESSNEVRKLWSRGVYEMFESDELPGYLDAPLSDIRTGIGILRSQGFTDFGGLLRSVMQDETDPRDLIEVAKDGRRVLVPKWAYEHLMGNSLECLRTAFAVMADVAAEPRTSVVVESDSEVPDSTEEPERSEVEDSTDEPQGTGLPVAANAFVDGAARANSGLGSLLDTQISKALVQVLKGEIPQ